MSNRLGLNMKRSSREDIENGRTDNDRFLLSEDYPLRNLKYFKSNFNRMMFQDYYLKDKKFSNETILAFAEISTPLLHLIWKVHTPLTMMYGVHRGEFMHTGVTFYNIPESICCELYHMALSQLADEVKSSETELNLQSHFKTAMRQKFVCFKRNMR